MPADRIDVHTHMIPPFWAHALADKVGKPMWGTPEWSLDAAVAVMDRLGTRTAMISLATPSVSQWDGTERIDMARQVNDFGAGLREAKPDRIGMFATLPLPDVNGAIPEIRRAFDDLGADGVLVMSNYGGTYLGDEHFTPMWEELNRRGAVVFVHPGNPEMKPLPGVPQPVLDFPMDTTRTALSLVTGGVMARFPAVKIILSHAGGFLPYAATRFAVLLHDYVLKDTSIEHVLAQLRQFYFDTALSPPDGLPSLLAFADPSHILFGADNPYISADNQALFSSHLDGYEDMEPDQLDAINHGNARILFPRLRR